MSVKGHLGFYNTATSRTHVRFMFSTHAAAGGNVAPNSAFENTDIRIYKATDGAAHSATQRSSSNGITMTSPFDTLTGLHEVDIDLADNTDAGFYVAGFYTVVLAPDETVDSQTLTGVPLCEFEIGVQPVNVTQWLGTAAATPTVGGVPEVDVTHWLGTAAATPSVAGVPEVDITHIGGTAFASAVINANITQVSGDTTAADNLEAALDGTAGGVPSSGIIDQGTAQAATASTLTLRAGAVFQDNALIGATVVIVSGTNGVGQSRVIIDSVESTDVVTVSPDFDPTPTGAIVYKVYYSAPPATTQAAEIADAVWEEQLGDHEGTVGSTAEALATAGGSGASAADIADAVWDEATAGHTTAGTFGEQLKTDVDAILVDTAEIGAAGAGLTAINLPNQTMDIVGTITGNLTGSVGSVTGAVGSVTGAVGSVTGAVGSVTGNVGGNVAGSVGSVAANGVSAASLAADAGAEIGAAVLAAAAADPIAANVEQVHSTALTGTGTEIDPWGPA